MRRDSLLLLGLLTTICLIAGLVAGIQSGKLVAPPPSASPTPPAATLASPAFPATSLSPAPILQPILSTRQMALLIVGVADKKAAQPTFEGGWIVAFNPGINRYYVIGFAPEARFLSNGRGPEATLAEIYGQGVQQQLGFQFVRDSIQAAFAAMSIQAVITVDRDDLADLAKKVGGVSIGGQRLTGTSLTAAYDTQQFLGAEARMAFQHAAFQALFQALADQQWSPGSLAAYLTQLPGAVDAPNAAALSGMVGDAPTLQSSELIWPVVGGTPETTPAP